MRTGCSKGLGAQRPWWLNALANYCSVIADIAALLVIFVGWRLTQPFRACGSVIINDLRESPWLCVGPDQLYSGNPLGYWYIAGGVCILAISAFLSRLVVRRARAARAREVVRPLRPDILLWDRKPR